MLRLRDAKYCNLKLFLIFLVLYGHWIEPQTEHSAILLQVYRLIYAFHMPLFAFLGGLFLKNGSDCLRQCKRSLKLYLPLQALAVMMGMATPFTPYWYLWYLLSFAMWCAFAYLWFRFQAYGKTILAVLLLLGCAVGYIPFIGRGFSLSRSFVFLPYFWAGLLLKPEKRWNRAVGIFGLLLAIVVFYLMPLPSKFYYQAKAYGEVAFGFEKRFTCYLVGGGLCLFFLAFAPNGRYPFTKLGTDTMPAYLLHAPVVLLCRDLPIPTWIGPILCALFLYSIFKLLQWRQALYGIYEGGRKWQPFKRSTSNTQQWSTDSCWP